MAATKRVMDQLDGPLILVGNSYGGSIITFAGTPQGKGSGLRRRIEAPPLTFDSRNQLISTVIARSSLWQLEKNRRRTGS